MSVTIEYRPFSALAVASLLLAAIALLGFIFPEASVVAILGALAGLAAMREIRKYHHGGKTVARAGIAACLTVLVLTQSWHFALYSSEAALGATRLDFQTVGASKDQGFAQHLGQLVCLKGYPVSEGSVFVMWAKQGENYVGYRNESSSILVFLSPGVTWNFNEWAGDSVAVSGIVARNPVRDGPRAPEFCVQQATVRPCRTLYGLQP